MVDCDVSTVAQENSFVSLVRRVVSCVDAVAKVFEEVETEVFVLVFRIDQTKVSISSRTREWIRRCILLCRVV